MKDDIILNNLGLIYKVIKDLNCCIKNDDDFEEYYFAGLMGLISASKTYDNNKSKSNYLYVSIKKRIINQFQIRNRAKRYTPHRNISSNIVVNEVELESLIPSKTNIEKKVTDKVLVEWLLGKLKNKQYKAYIIEYYGIGVPSLNMQEMALKYGKSKQYIHQSIQMGLRLMRKELE